MKVVVNPNRVEDYRLFLRAKSLPSFRCVGNALEFPDEYAKQVMGKAQRQKADIGGEPWEGLFDYQRDITEMSLRKRKFCCFAECGLGKTLILLEFARRVSATIPRKGTLIVSPLMVVRQTLAEADKSRPVIFNRGYPRVRASALRITMAFMRNCGPAILGRWLRMSRAR